MKKYIVIEIVDREVGCNIVCDTLDEAQREMQTTFFNSLSKICQEDISTLKEADDYGIECGISNYNAWINDKYNYDWHIIEIEV